MALITIPSAFTISTPSKTLTSSLVDTEYYKVLLQFMSQYLSKYCDINSIIAKDNKSESIAKDNIEGHIDQWLHNYKSNNL